jgi:tetratricopeptide (TPR) repeat protein
VQPGTIGSVCGQTRLLSARIPAPPPRARRRSFSFIPGALLLCALLVDVPPARADSLRQGATSPADGAAALQSAAALVQQGRLDEAEQQARRGLSDPATQAPAYSVLGTIRFRQKRFDDSIILFKKAIRLDDRLLGAHLSLADVYMLQGKPELARPLYEHVLKLDPSNAAARLALARSEAEKGQYQRSLDLAAPVMTAFKQTPDGLFILTTDFLKTGDRAAAAALTSDWVRLENVPPEWSIKYGVLFATHGAGPEAVRILERVRETSGPSYDLALNLAGAYVVNDDPARALDTYDAALALRPDSMPALRQAAVLAERRGELERSLSYWLRAKKIEPEDPEILLGFGRVCLRMDLLEDAEPALTKAASLKPDDRTCQYTLAAAKVGKRQFEAAQHLVEPLVDKQPADPQLQYALGSILYLQGHLAEAATHLGESLRLQPEQLASHYYLALVVRDQGNDAEAIAMLEKLLQRFPEHAAASEALGLLLMSAQRYDEAERYLRTAIRLNPKLVKANYQLGLLLARTGRKEEADRQLALAKTLREEDEAHSRLQLRLLDPGQ